MAKPAQSVAPAWMPSRKGAADLVYLASLRPEVIRRFASPLETRLAEDAPMFPPWPPEPAPARAISGPSRRYATQRGGTAR